MAAPLGRDTLPDHWSYGVCKDGRVFFINDETHSTTWLHPRTGEPVNSGHMIRSDLPRGWEEGFTEEGASYFIDHNQRTTAFRHPVTGQISPENIDFVLREQPNSCMSKPHPEQRPSSMVSESSTAVTSSTVDTASGSKGSRSSGKVHSFGKRDHAIKRNLNVPVVVRGWLYKQDSSGMRLWKRKWFVLSDYCLFYYKDSREETVLGSIPLPSYVISPVEPEDHISRKYAFKATHTGMRSYIYNKNAVIGSQAEHCGMRTYFFSADTQEDMNGWVRAMNQAALMQTHSLKRESEKSEKPERQAVPQANHVNSLSRSPAQPERQQRAERAVEQPPAGERREETREPQEVERRHGGRRDAVEGGGRARPAACVAAVDTLSPDSAGSSRPSSTLPSSAHRNGNGPPPEQNGGVVYKRGLVPRTDTEKQVQRKTALAQVEHWVKVQKGDAKSLPSEHTLPRRTPPTQHRVSAVEAYQTLPKTSRVSSGGSSPQVPRNLPSDYKYAQDRLSHLRMSTGERTATKEGTVWQLYEWQQRQRFRHGSPTAPIYAPVPLDYTDSAPYRVTLEVPRCISVPPSPADIPPPGPPPKALSPGRPHTPAERVTVRPSDERTAVEVPPSSSSPRRPRSQLSKNACVERRSMPAMGYITHTVSAPSLHGKTPEELTLLLIQLRREQATMASVRNDALAHLRQLSGPSHPRLQADDTYIQLKKDLEYLDLKIKSIEPLILTVHCVLQNSPQGFESGLNVTGHETLKDRPAKPVKIAESDVDVKLSRLCEQDKILQELEARMRTLKEDKDKLESVLDVAHQQLEQYRDQPAHAEKIAYQQRLLQEDVVHIRAEMSQVTTEMENAWNEYGKLEMDLAQLREALQEQMGRNTLSQQEKAQMKRELWRMEDVMAGLSSSKANYKVSIDSVQNPERKLVPSVSSPVPSQRVSAAHLSSAQPTNDSKPSQSGPAQPAWAHQGPALHVSAPKWAEEDVPPRPPLPQLYSPDEQPPTVPPLPKEASVIRHTSVRGLKRQSDERKRDREIGHCPNGENKVELRSYLSEPELSGVGSGSGHVIMGSLGSDGGYQTLPSRGLAGSTSRLNQSTNISSYVTLRRGVTATGLKERPKSALERLYSVDAVQRGKMSAEEQLERMKRHQKALVRERKRTLSQGERQSSSSRASSSPRPLSADLGSWRREQEFDLQLLERAVQGEERPIEHQEIQRPRSDEWLTVHATPMRELDLEPLDYNLDLSRELSKPEKVSIPERYVDLEPQEPLSQLEMEARHRKVERIKSILAKSSVQNMPPPLAVDKLEVTDMDSALQEQERIITMSYALASEASQKSKQVAAKAVSQH
ncbi:pleckstrin homology domain-containing family A member 7-like isoform X2 [Megalops cyprinoides]|uniref:pleckstrin homology domain-containing family A member 7-like isoform X2 n=1 Tax=Megalops cyprinoides TaxID=118141 RepID=UPI0018655AAD|nr:pleckstrin homology domain-containing family A member 7-like isoform X2 [Megalops cyprinoides]